MQYIAAIFALLLLGACTSVSPASSSNQAAVAEIMQTDRDFAAASLQRGADAWADYWAENGSKPDGPKAAIFGKEAVRKQMAPLFESGAKLEWHPVSGEVSKGGTIGTTWGRFKLTSTEEGKGRVSEGTYISVWKKQTDGSWKILFDAGDGDQRQQ